MSVPPNCPSCDSAFTYQDGDVFVCPECGREWTSTGAAGHGEEHVVHKDAVGNVLANGDSVTIVNDLKVKGAGAPLKAGTKVRNIRLVDEDHNIDCRIEGFGAMRLKSGFVRKAQA